MLEYFQEKESFTKLNFKEGELLVIRMDQVSGSNFIGYEKYPLNKQYDKVMVKSIKRMLNRFKYVKYAYSFSDEVNFIIPYSELNNGKDFKNEFRAEKIISKITSIFTAFFNQEYYLMVKEKDLFDNKIYSDRLFNAFFDCRYLVIKNNEVKKYIASRQYYALVNASFFFILEQLGKRNNHQFKSLIYPNTYEENLKIIEEEGLEWDKDDIGKLFIVHKNGVVRSIELLRDNIYLKQ